MNSLKVIIQCVEHFRLVNGGGYKFFLDKGVADWLHTVGMVSTGMTKVLYTLSPSIRIFGWTVMKVLHAGWNVGFIVVSLELRILMNDNPIVVLGVIVSFIL